jgi:hypothetical protein
MTIMLSGQRCSGKSYTLSNTTNGTHGIIPLAIHDIFNILSSNTDYEYKTKVSYIWINGEDVTDLLKFDSIDTLDIEESIEKGTIIPQLTKQRVYNKDDVIQLLDIANTSMFFKATYSGYSTCYSNTIFNFSIKIRNKLTNEIIHSKFQCIKLSGSDPSSKGTPLNNESGESPRILESSNRTRARELDGLESIFSILQQSERRFIPWSDHKLTRLLRESFTGSRISLIVNLSPDDASRGESVSSIQFANLAKSVSLVINNNNN